MLSKEILAAGALAAALALSGCTVAPAPGPGPGPGQPADCGAAALQDKIGLPVTGTNAEDVRLGGAPVVSRGSVRVIHPGQGVTMDFRAERLNLEVDASGNLVRANCA